MSTCMIFNYCVYRSTVSARLCLVVPFCCHMSNDHTDVLFERINDEDDDDLVTQIRYEPSPVKEIHTHAVDLPFE